MVKSFRFSRLPGILFKSGIISDLPSLIKSYGNKICLVTGRSSFSGSEFSESLFENFKKAGISYSLVNIEHEPSSDDIDTAVVNLAGNGIDLVVGIGGGSVLDAGKAISAMMNRKESVVEFLEGVGTRMHPGTKLPYIAVPTTSGTGSEATKNAVISRVGKDGFKKSLRHDNFVPDIAVVDPLLTVHCPKNITASSGMDAFTQLVEAYLSDKSCEYTEALAIEGLKSVKDSFLRCYNNGEDIDARSGMSFAALTSGICLANAGLGVVHGFASSIGAFCNIPHGLICGSLMPKANEINVRELRKQNNNRTALGKYATLGRIFLNLSGESDSYYIDGFVDYLFQLAEKTGLTGFGANKLTENDIITICSLTETKNNPVRLAQNDLFEILSSVN